MHHITRRTTPSQVPCAHDPACKALNMVSVRNYLQYLPVLVHADPYDSSNTSSHHSKILTPRKPRVIRASLSTQHLRICVRSVTHSISYWEGMAVLHEFVPSRAILPRPVLTPRINYECLQSCCIRTRPSVHCRSTYERCQQVDVVQSYSG